MKKIYINVINDSFIHFTYRNRAEEIINNGKLLINPPYDKFGIEGVQAVSVNYGEYIPSVQLTHLQNNENNDIVGLHFKTNTVPDYGYVEEVIWKRNVNLINPTILSVEETIKLLKNRTNNDVQLVYETLLNHLMENYYEQISNSNEKRS